MSQPIVAIKATSEEIGLKYLVRIGDTIQNGKLSDSFRNAQWKMPVECI